MVALPDRCCASRCTLTAATTTRPVGRARPRPGRGGERHVRLLLRGRPVQAGRDAGDVTTTCSTARRSTTTSARSRSTCAAPGFGNETPARELRRQALRPDPAADVRLPRAGRERHLRRPPLAPAAGPQPRARDPRVPARQPHQVPLHQRVPPAPLRSAREHPRRASARVRFSYMDYYDAESAACVERLYEQDFALFGFPSSTSEKAWRRSRLGRHRARQGADAERRADICGANATCPAATWAR